MLEKVYIQLYLPACIHKYACVHKHCMVARIGEVDRYVCIVCVYVCMYVSI
jgi:hypothetical protein